METFAADELQRLAPSIPSFLQRLGTIIGLKSDTLVPSLEFARPMSLDLSREGGLAVTGIALGGRTSGASRRWFCPKSYASVCVVEV